MRTHTILLMSWLITTGLPPASLCAQKNQHNSAAPGLEQMPNGWEVTREVAVSGQQLAQFSKKLNVPLVSLFNTFIRTGGQDLQINSLTANNAADAERLKVQLRKAKSNPLWVVRSKNHVYEFVVQRPEQARLVSRARGELAILPASQTYAVQFAAIPIESEAAEIGPDGRNRLFNFLLQSSSGSAVDKEIAALARHYTFAKKIQLIKNLHGAVVADWSSAEATPSGSSGGPEFVDLQIARSQQVQGMPMINLKADIKIDRTQQRKVDAKLDRQPMLLASTRFPADAPEIQSAVKSVVSGTGTDEQKLNQLLQWFADSKNIRYEGLVGSRYGTRTVFKQHFGRCWDYADLFVTMARAAGLPCRQAYGWLHESEGHVWCDVLVDGHWLMVDPTSSAACDISYIPFCLSANGEFPLIYASRVQITEKSN